MHTNSQLIVVATLAAIASLSPTASAQQVDALPGAAPVPSESALSDSAPVPDNVASEAEEPEPASAGAPADVDDAGDGADAGAARLRVAVYDFALDGIEPRIGRIVTEAVAKEMRKLDGLLVISMEEVRAMLELEEDKAMLGCSESESCLSEIGDALGVDGLVVGQLVSLGTETVFILRRIDQRNAAVIGTVNTRLTPANGE